MTLFITHRPLEILFLHLIKVFRSYKPTGSGYNFHLVYLNISGDYSWYVMFSVAEIMACTFIEVCILNLHNYTKFEFLCSFFTLWFPILASIDSNVVTIVFLHFFLCRWLRTELGVEHVCRVFSIYAKCLIIFGFVWYFLHKIFLKVF